MLVYGSYLDGGETNVLINNGSKMLFLANQFSITARRNNNG